VENVRKKGLVYLDKVTKSLEIAIALLLLAVVGIRIVEIVMAIIGLDITILNMDFDRVLSISLALVISVEFVRMLCKHTPETVIDVLLFAIARQIVVYHDAPIDMLIGVAAIIGLFAAKKYLIDMDMFKRTSKKDS
jgi:hypothetical protein